MSNPPLRLRMLLREKHWQTHRTFRAEYDKAAKSIDPKLVGTGPSRAQLHRWLSGELKGLPYPDHCRVLEKMLPGWTAQQLFEVVRTEELQPSNTSVGQLLDVIESRLDAPDSVDIDWGRPSPAPAIAQPDLPAALSSQAEGAHGPARELGRRLLELKRIRRLSDEESNQLAGLSGNIVELSVRIDFDIDPHGWAQVAYRQELLNLTAKPLTRIAREVWFEHTNGPLTITPITEGDRRIMIQRVHDTANLSKFACQLSPPLQPGETAMIGYVCEGGRFVEDHYWRQNIPRYTRQLTIRVRHRGAGQLIRCMATEEHDDGSENSAADGIMWDYEDDDVVLTLTRDYLHPNQAVTLRWEIPH
jgi:hypothetical protein